MSANNTVVVKNTTFTGTNRPVDIDTPGWTKDNTDPRATATKVELENVTFVESQHLSITSRTISLKDVTLDKGTLSSGNGVLNVGSVMDGAVNFVSGVKTNAGTDLTTAAGINSTVHVVSGDIRLNGAKFSGATGTSTGAIIINTRQ